MKKEEDAAGFLEKVYEGALLRHREI